MDWVDTLPPKVALDSHTVCNNATGYCRAMAHYVFTATPADVTLPLVGGAKVSLDGVESMGTPARFEAHLVTGICPNHTDASSCEVGSPRQMWDWNYDATFPMTELEHAPAEVCAAPFLRSPFTGEAGSLAARCLPLQPVSYVNVPRSLNGFQPKFIYANLSDVASHHCSSEHCRTNVHVVVLASVPDPTDTVEATAQFSIDDGDWRTDSSSVFFENKMSLKPDGSWYQTFQWDYDSVSPGSSLAPGRVCFKLDIVNRVSMESVPFDFGQFAEPESGGTVRCLDFCEQLAPFHSPAGYCGGSSGAYLV